jgi:hypothetical protein
MVPTDSEDGPLTGITRDGSQVDYTTEVIKGTKFVRWGERR